MILLFVTIMHPCLFGWFILEHLRPSCERELALSGHKVAVPGSSRTNTSLNP